MRIAVNRVFLLFAERAIDKPGLTEPASPDTAAQHLDHRAVVHRLRKRHHKIFRIEHLVQIADDPFVYDRRRTLLRSNCGDRPVRMIAHLVEGRDINPFNLCRAPQELLLGTSLFFADEIEVHQFEVDLLPLPEDKQVDKIGDRLRVAGAGAARYHHRPEVAAVFGAHLQPRQIEHVQDRSKTHLILQGKTDEIEPPNRVEALQTVKWYSPLPHELFHILVGRENPFAPIVFPRVGQRIEDFHA